MDFWDRFSGLYDLAESLNKRAYNKMTKEISDLIPKGAVTLDCAAGTGALSVPASKNSKEVICTDMSTAMLEQAKKKCKSKGITNIKFEIRDITKLSDSDNSFDVCIAGNILHLIDNPQKAIKELARVTKSGGMIILPTFLSKEGNLFAKLLLKAYKLIGFKPSYEWDIKEYKQMIKESSCGKARFKLLNGTIPVGFAVIKVNK